MQASQTASTAQGRPRNGIVKMFSHMNDSLGPSLIICGNEQITDRAAASREHWYTLSMRSSVVGQRV